jgi:hypothetical protein
MEKCCCISLGGREEAERNNVMTGDTCLWKNAYFVIGLETEQIIILLLHEERL